MLESTKQNHKKQKTVQKTCTSKKIQHKLQIYIKNYAKKGSIDGVDYKFMTVVTVKNGSVYILTYTSLASSYDNNISDFTEVIRNFRFKD